jgi:hypothetical protein
LINQDGLKITNESYGKVYVLEFSLLPALLFVQNESKYVVDREEIFGNQISE